MERTGEREINATQFFILLITKILNKIKEEKKTCKDLFLEMSAGKGFIQKREIVKKIIEKANKKTNELIEKGYKETEDGLMSPSEIKEAGYIYNADLKKYVIPAQYYIAEDNIGGHRKGEKYLGISRKYLEFAKKRFPNQFNNEEALDSYIIKQLEKEIKF